VTLTSHARPLLPRRTDLHIVRHLVALEFRVRYSRSVIGWAWSLLQPVSRLVILSFIFTRAIPLDIDNYAAFLFVGLVSWQWFASGVSASTNSLVGQSGMLSRPGLHLAVLPTVAVLSAALDAFVALVILLVFLIITSGLSVLVLLLPAVIVLQFLMIVGIGALLCVANVYSRDVRLLVELALVLGFYLTPVFYKYQVLPDEVQQVVALNPMTWMIGVQRAVLIGDEFPGAATIAVLIVTCCALFVAGVVVFHRTSHSVIDEL
jgi:lipopolysaccharide transport system permease protein